MSSYRQILYHLTFHTKDSKKVLRYADNDELFKYIWGVIKITIANSTELMG